MPYRNGDYLGAPDVPTTLMTQLLMEGHSKEELIEALVYVRDLGADEIDSRAVALAGGPDDGTPRWRLLDLAFKGLLFERGMLT